jgi:hypothetical protein
MGQTMKKSPDKLSKVESWYPSAKEIVLTQQEQALKSRENAAAFASQKFGKATSSWWRRLMRMRS